MLKIGDVVIRELFDAVNCKTNVRMDHKKSEKHVIDSYTSEGNNRSDCIRGMLILLNDMVDPVKEDLTFGAAIEALKAGLKVARKGWNGKGMWLILVTGSENIKPVAGTPYSKAGLTSEIQILPHIDMYTTDSTGRRAMLPGWLASQTDMLSEDWVIIE